VFSKFFSIFEAFVFKKTLKPSEPGIFCPRGRIYELVSAGNFCQQVKKFKIAGNYFGEIILLKSYHLKCRISNVVNCWFQSRQDAATSDSRFEGGNGKCSGQTAGTQVSHSRIYICTFVVLIHICCTYTYLLYVYIFVVLIHICCTYTYLLYINSIMEGLCLSGRTTVNPHLKDVAVNSISTHLTIAHSLLLSYVWPLQLN
jgi:hypothetical protein